MITKFKIALEQKELEALQETADDEVRSAAGQARHWIRTALRKAGKLNDKTSEQNVIHLLLLGNNQRRAAEEAGVAPATVSAAISATSTERLRLSTRAFNGLCRNKITTLGGVLGLVKDCREGSRWRSLGALHNVGETSYMETLEATIVTMYEWLVHGGLVNPPTGELGAHPPKDNEQ